MCGFLLHTPYWGPDLQPKHVPWLGIKPATFAFAGWHSIHWATAARANSQLLKRKAILFFQLPSVSSVLTPVPSGRYFSNVPSVNSGYLIAAILPLLAREHLLAPRVSRHIISIIPKRFFGIRRGKCVWWAQIRLDGNDLFFFFQTVILKCHGEIKHIIWGEGGMQYNEKELSAGFI